MVKIYAPADIWTGRRYFGKSCWYNSRYSTGETPPWAAWVLISLEDCMEERQHHLNESSSARLGRSQKLEILPSPNSKSLGAYFLMDAYILIGAEISTSALILSYVMRRTYFGCAHMFWICAYILNMRIYFEKTHTFWESAYILNMCIYFGKAHIFWTCAYILDMRIYFEQVLTFWADVNILCISGYFRQVPIIDDFCSKFCLVWFSQ